MEYRGDFPPTPEERAGLRLAANADWLARAKKDGHAPGGPYHEYPDWEALDEKTMADDNRRALAAAKQAIEAERKRHKCYVCGRLDLPRHARWFVLWAALFLGVWLFFERKGGGGEMFGIIGVAAVGVAFGAGLHENSDEPDDEEELKRKFDATPHA